MTTHCKEGDKPVVNYSFDGSKRIFKSEYAPIDIEIKELPVEATSEFSEDGFQLTITGRFGDAATYVLKDFKIINDPLGDGSYKLLVRMLCGQTTYAKVPCTASNEKYGCLAGVSAIKNPPEYTINKNIKCLNTGERRCSIIIKYKGIIIHQAQGDCPVNYSVQCGNCPGGQHECESKSPPFYCCSDCASTANKISKLINKYGRTL